MSFIIPNFDFSSLGKKEDVKAAKAAFTAVVEEVAAQQMGYDSPEIIKPESIEAALELLDRHNLLVAPNGAPLNTEQRLFVAHVVCGISCSLIGAAGTGKTTAVQASMKALIELGLTGMIPKGSLKHISEDAPSIVACAFTNRAARNIATKLPAGMQENALTHHKLCEYVPVDKNSTETKRFIPSRTHKNPLPALDVVYYEEASMLDHELYKIQEAAYNPALRPTEIVLGDMFQLPPIFGMSTLAQKLIELPTIELKEVYRQALESPIIRLAHAIKDGVAIPPFKRDQYTKPGELDIQYLPANVEPTHLAMQLGANMFKRMMQGEFRPSTDTVLIPNNKNFGQITINRSFYAELDKQYPEDCDPESLDALAPILWSDFPEMMERVAERQFKGFRPYKIQAGHMFHYYSEGDRVLFGSREGVILEIIRNSKFKKPVMIGKYTRWGKALDELDDGGGDFGLTFDDSPNNDPDADFDLDELAAKFEDAEGEREKAENQTSYILVLQLDDGSIVKVETRGELNTMNGAIATTVHKSQGLEFRRVYLLLHKACGRLLSNEIVYTGITRARESLCILCQQDSLSVAAGRRQIKGANLQEKIDWIHEEIKRQQLSGRYRDSEG